MPTTPARRSSSTRTPPASGTRERGGCYFRDDDPARPPNEETFQDHRKFEIGGERIDLAWHGANHSPDNVIIHLPDHDTPSCSSTSSTPAGHRSTSNLTEDIPGYIEGPANTLAYSWKHFIGGHLGRLGTRDDVALHQQYMADIAASVRNAIDTFDPTPYYQMYGENIWAAVKAHLDTTTEAAARPVMRSTRACSPPPTCSRRARPSGSWSPSASTSATARRCTPDGQPPGTPPGWQSPADAAERRASGRQRLYGVDHGPKPK